MSVKQKPTSKKLPDKGISIPSFLYGTAWKEEATQRCVTTALQAGFRGIDTANQRKHYYEAGVGLALLEAYNSNLLSREEVFLQSKFTHLGGQDRRLPYEASASIAEQVEQSFSSTLEHLYSEQLDSYLLHGPSSSHGLKQQDWETWEAILKLKTQGKVRLIGVSNFSAEQLRLLCERSEMKPDFVQNRCFASTAWDKEVRQYCMEHAIIYQGFSLLTANTSILQLSQFQELLGRYSCTSAQLIFSFALHIGMLALTGTQNATHMAEDLKACQIEISAQDLARLESIALR